MSEKRYKIATLGCRTNQYESQAYADQLEAVGYVEAGEGRADICVVNTCTVTASADSRSLYQVRKLRREHPEAQLFVTGCFAERDKGALKEIGAEVIGNADKEILIERALPEEVVPEFAIRRFEAHTRAFVKIQDGCNSYCSYCIIPFVRGRSRSRDEDDIVREVEGLALSGYKEIVLTGINIGDYEHGLARLVRRLDRLEGLERIRISSIDPDEIDDDLLDAVVSGKKTCQSMHIVLQAGANATLKRMNRKYTKQEFMRSVARLKEASPDFTFTTDIIVGFPGETAGDFTETCEVVEQVRFAKVHMFPYSLRPKTRAARFEQLPQRVVMERKNELLRLSERVAYELREGYVGRELDVLIEGNGMGHSDNFLPVSVEGRPNTIVRARCTANSPEGLIGAPL
jgi:threonylcarbamoyladenosine tRNA methylthiotransferase MtaB